jgi:REP element-mobilizing transposase RayT
VRKEKGAKSNYRCPKLDLSPFSHGGTVDNGPAIYRWGLGHLVTCRPGGTVDNSPAIYRWGWDRATAVSVPEGRLSRLWSIWAWVIPLPAGLYHCVFSTKERRSFIDEELQTRLFPFMGGIARENRMKAITIGGVADHVHLLLSLPSTMAVAKALPLIKGGSSAWVHESFPQHRGFTWQEGYGAFSLGISQVDPTITYIESQAKHHRRRSFQEEFLAFLKKHRIPYDERYIWD